MDGLSPTPRTLLNGVTGRLLQWHILPTLHTTSDLLVVEWWVGEPQPRPSGGERGDQKAVFAQRALWPTLHPGLPPLPRLYLRREASLGTQGADCVQRE